MFELKDMPSVIGLPSIFTPKECDEIIQLGLTLRQESGRLSGKSTITREGDIAWVDPVANHGLTEKIFKTVEHVNKHMWKFSLYGFLEAMQFSIYKQDDHYGWHKDLGTQKLSMRKLSFSIQLTDSDKYEGGDLEFITNNFKAHRALGTMNIFPSYEVHRVTPVTKGCRYALVGWVSGKPLV